MTHPVSDPVQRSILLRKEADVVLQEIKVEEILSPTGRIVPTGSYYLDLMMFPDIDLYIPQVSLDQIFQIGAQLARSEKVFQVVFERSRNLALPGGLYLKPRIAHGDWGRPWKVDIWSLDNGIIDGLMAEMHRLARAVSAPLRTQILEYKYSVLTTEHRTPRFSGYPIYKAFVDEGLSRFEDVTQYLLEHGIVME